MSEQPTTEALALARELLRGFADDKWKEEAALRLDRFAAERAAQDTADLDFLDAEAKRRGCDLTILESRGGDSALKWAGIEWGDGTSVRAAIAEAMQAREGKL